MIAAYALLFGSTLAPAELDAAGLARVLAAQSGGQSVVAMVNGRTAAVDEAGSTDTVSAELKKRNVRFLPGAVTIAHAEILPDAAMQNIARLRKADPTRKAKAMPLPQEALKGGKVTFVSEAGTTLDLQALKTLAWGQPLVLSPAFADALAGTDLAVNVKDLDQTEFLRSVAKAIGGRFRSDGKALYIEASGGELRARALRTIDLAAREPRQEAENAMNLADAQTETDEEAVPSGRPQRRSRGPLTRNPATFAAQLDLARAVTNSISSRDFERFMNGEAETVTVDLAGQSATQNALVRLLRANASEPPEAARVNRLLATVPPKAPGVIVLGDGYSIDATLNTVDRRGNAGRTVRLKAL